MSVAAQLRLAASTLLDRYRFARQNGLGFGGARNYYEVLGYDEIVTSRQYRLEYARGGIAKRIVEAFPKATWRGGVELFEDEDPEVSTAFEQAWKSLEQRLNVWSLFQKADILAGLSTYSAILIGAPGDLGSELPKGTSPDQILYLTPFWGGGGPGLNTRNQTMAMDADCRIATFDEDVTSPRFGEPLTYNLKRVDVVNPVFQRPVHWSRIIHLAEGCLDDNVYGTPTLENVWNLLQDLMKVTGGGAEAFWLRANQGIQIDIDKDMALPPSTTELADLKAQAEDYKHQLTRMMRTRGVNINQLGSDVANFASPAEAILTQIAGSKGIPMRILTGSERGELASSQDAANFSTQVQDRRTSYAGPMIVRRFVDRLIEFGYLPTPKSYEVGWPTIETMTDMEKATGAQKWAETNSTAGMPIYTDAEIREHWHGFKPLTDEQKASMQPPAPVEPPVDEAALAAEAAALEATLKAAQRAETPEDAELVRVLAAAIEAGNGEVVAAIVGLRVAGGPGSGNFGHGGRPGQVGGSSSAGGSASKEEIAASVGTEADFKPTAIELEHKPMLDAAEAKIAEQYKSGDTYSKHYNKETGVWSPEREAQHLELLASKLAGKPAGLERPTAILMAGLPASGKSTLVDGLDQSDYVVVNADDFKEDLEGYNGSNAALFHRESAYIADLLFDSAVDRKQNIILDGTLKTSGALDDGGALGKIRDLKAAGYDVDVRFVDVDVETAVDRSVMRFVTREKNSGDGRYVPPSFIRETGYKPRETYERAKATGLIDRWMKVDNRGDDAVVIERGSKG